MSPDDVKHLYADLEERKRLAAEEREWVARQEAILATSDDPEARRVARLELAAYRCETCRGTGYAISVLPEDPRFQPPPLCPCQNLESE
jgi:hypothetical protein